jgi:hypothetical protein
MNTGEILSVFCHNFQQSAPAPSNDDDQNVGMRATDFQTHQHHQLPRNVISTNLAVICGQLCAGPPMSAT